MNIFDFYCMECGADLAVCKRLPHNTEVGLFFALKLTEYLFMNIVGTLLQNPRMSSSSDIGFLTAFEKPS